MDVLADELCAWHFRGTIFQRSTILAARKIQDDEISILIDLAGHAPNNRLLIFARKPAPIQVVWPTNSTPPVLRTMDYDKSHPITTPPGSPQRFTEEDLHLPTRLCWSHRILHRMSCNEVSPNGSCWAGSTGLTR